MKKFFALFMVLLTILSCSATENDVPQLASASDGTLFNGKKVLVAYFSWGGTTRRMAETIENVTKGDIFEIEPVVPYPTAYTPCTEVALEEKTIVHVRKSRTALKTGQTMILFSLVVRYGGGQLL